MAPFYTTLDPSKQEIRLLTVYPAADRSAPIRCSLHTASLLDKPSYKALSYTWGPTQLLESISVNDVDFQATANLQLALRYIRHEKETLTVWIDAVCINQKDNAEKSAQIPLMRAIYAGAEKVLVWLGEEEGDSYTTLRMIWFTDLWVPKRIREGVAQNEVFEELSTFLQTGLEQLDEFLKRPWWTRIWVVQEVALARDVTLLCGDESMPWEVFAKVFWIWIQLVEGAREQGLLGPHMQLFRSYIKDSNAAKILMLQMFCQQHDGVESWPFGLFDLLKQGYLFESTDPRDKIFAWLGLVKNDDVIFVPDYDEPVPTVYARAVKAVLEHSGSLALVGMAGTGMFRGTPVLHGLPSWVPDFRKPHSDLPKFQALGIGDWNAPAAQQAVASVSLETMALKAEATRIGYIDFADADKEEHTLEKCREKLSRWLFAVLDRNSRLSCGNRPVYEALFNILTTSDGQDLDLDALRLGFMVEIGSRIRAKDLLAGINPGERSYKIYAKYTKDTPLVDEDPKNIKAEETGDTVVTLSFPSRSSGSSKDENDGGTPPQQNPDAIDLGCLFDFFKCWDVDIHDPNITGPYKRIFSRLLEKTIDTAVEKGYTTPDVDTELRDEMALMKVRFSHQFVSVSMGKAMFTTDSGLLGLGMGAVQVGDQVCLLRGCALPLVLRQYRDHFEVIGQCYVPGAMGGEYFAGGGANEIRWEMLEFR